MGHRSRFIRCNECGNVLAAHEAAGLKIERGHLEATLEGTLQARLFCDAAECGAANVIGLSIQIGRDGHPASLTTWEATAPPPNLLLPAGGASEARTLHGPKSQDEALLVVDLPERRVSFFGKVVRMRPPDNLQPQALLALAILAGRPGETVTMAELAEEMVRFGTLKRPIAPEPRDLRYKVLHPIRAAIKDAGYPDDVERLVESVHGVGLRLNVHGSVKVIMQRPKRPSSPGNRQQLALL